MGCWDESIQLPVGRTEVRCGVSGQAASQFPLLKLILYHISGLAASM